MRTVLLVAIGAFIGAFIGLALGAGFGAAIASQDEISRSEAARSFRAIDKRLRALESATGVEAGLPPARAMVSPEVQREADRVYRALTTPEPDPIDVYNEVARRIAEEAR